MGGKREELGFGVGRMGREVTWGLEGQKREGKGVGKEWEEGKESEWVSGKRMEGKGRSDWLL